MRTSTLVDSEWTPICPEAFKICPERGLHTTQGPCIQSSSHTTRSVGQWKKRAALMNWEEWLAETYASDVNQPGQCQKGPNKVS